MEPGNLHLQHQFQEQSTGYSSSFSSLPAEYNNVSSTSDHFNPEAAGIILNISSNTHNNYLIDCIPNSCVSLPPVSLTQGLSFCQAFSFNQQSAASELLLGKTKEEFPDSFGKLSDMMHTSSNVEETDFLSSKYKHHYSHDLGGNQWPLNSFSSLRHLFYSNPQNEEYLQNLSACRGYNFSHFLPTINISNSDLCSSLVSSSLDLNLQTVDLLSTSSTCDGATSSSQSSENTLDHFMRELKDSPSNSYNKKSTFEDGYGRKKRPNSVSQSNNFLAEAKKNISDSATILPNFEGDDLKAAVRKEKLGDRIAALQWLVAPYGKTDTASVLTEAIGYIQFLHDQVQTLCAPPHMKSSDIKPTRTAQACSSEEDGKGQQKRDLRSRGLCLVPLSCVSFFRTCDGGIERSPRKELKMAYEKEI